MNLGKVKSFLIILFLGINIYLILSTALSSDFRIDENTVKNTVSVMENSGVKISKSLIPKKIENLKNIDTSNTVYTEKFKKSENAKYFKIYGDKFVCKIDKNIYNESNKKIVRHIKEFLTDSGFDSNFMKLTDISDKNGQKSFKIQCSVKGFSVFDSKISVKINKNGFTLEGTWYEPQTTYVKSNTKERQNVYITSVLIDFASTAKASGLTPLTVKKIETGYMSGSIYGKTGHITATALPYYKITDTNGNKYYYDAADGTYNINQ